RGCRHSPRLRPARAAALDPPARVPRPEREDHRGLVRMTRALEGFPDFDRLLDGRVALITGSGSGQGRAAALVMARRGARVAVVDFNEAGARETVQLLEEHDSEGMAVIVDVSQRASCDEMVAATIERFGRLDVLYNNAAVQMSGRVLDCTDEEWDITIATNLSAIFYACRAALPHML